MPVFGHKSILFVLKGPLPMLASFTSLALSCVQSPLATLVPVLANKSVLLALKGPLLLLYLVTRSTRARIAMRLLFMQSFAVRHLRGFTRHVWLHGVTICSQQPALLGPAHYEENTLALLEVSAGFLLPKQSPLKPFFSPSLVAFTPMEWTATCSIHRTTFSRSWIL
eukprot:scaffold70963_cov20-Tisochrysis_lutea.AAC.5